MVPVANHLSAVVSIKGGKVESMEEYQGQLLKLGLSAMKEPFFVGRSFHTDGWSVSLDHCFRFQHEADAVRVWRVVL